MRYVLAAAVLLSLPSCVLFWNPAPFSDSSMDGLSNWGEGSLGEGHITDVERLLALPPDVRATRETALAEALAAHRVAPNEDSDIWVGRRLAYLGLHEAALHWYMQRWDKLPTSFRLPRHLGHRCITVRSPEAAAVVLERARELAAGIPDELEPDGMPNAVGIPTSTTQGNIDYHLALARYCLGDFEAAAVAWRRCVDTWALNDDARVAAGHWLCQTLRRLGRTAELDELLERLPVEPNVIENHAYAALLDLHAGRATVNEVLAGTDDTVQDATRVYGAARWLLDRPEATPDERARGAALLERLAREGPWESFGRIAAEFDLGLAVGRSLGAHMASWWIPRDV